MTKSITIRNVSDGTVNELASRAATTGRSLQEYLRLKLEELAGNTDSEVWLARVRARKAANPTFMSSEDILRDLHADRR